jgi:hypothetical protein
MQSAARPRDLHENVQRLTARAPRPPTGNRPQRRAIRPPRPPNERRVGGRVRNGLHCGRKWVTVGHACGTRVAGLLPPGHPGSEFAQAA